MQQQQLYSAKFIVVNSQGNCALYPQTGGQQQSSQPAEFCIGYIRAVVPKSIPSGGPGTQTTVNLLYTGHPCHRAYVILVPIQQTGQTKVTVTEDTPVVDIIACLEQRQNNWEYKPEPLKFDVIFDGVSLNWSQNVNIDKKECKIEELIQLLQNLIQQQQPQLDIIKKKLPSSISVYYVK